MSQTLELLAPARNLECGMAAIDHGADAVYIGAERFGARAAAGNSVADIARLCDYAHQFSARVYVTVNTILYDAELDSTLQLLDRLAEAHVDAVLVQDMALLPSGSSASGLRQLVSHSPLPLHASTQTDNRTAGKVAWLASLGFRRVVLARELSLSEISAIHEAVPQVELEVFVHGALCVSYSGQCYASQYCFGRSANRGECAQFCRLPFDLVDARGRVLQHNRHLLSLKDLNLSRHLQELADAGASSFKIEGRLKDLAYVKNVTAFYSQQLEALVRRSPDRYRRSSKGKCAYRFVPDLNRTFNRGYTTYFLHGRQPDIASFDTPKALGEYVGTVKELRHDSLTVAGVGRFANGDGLCFLSQQVVDGHRVNRLVGFRVNRATGNRLFPQHMPDGLRPGLRLYRNSDQEFDALLARPSAERRMSITLSLRPTADGFCLSAGDQGVTVRMAHEQAATPQRDNIVRQLSKWGNTPFVCSAVNLPDGFNYFIPSSQLAAMRRQLCRQLLAAAVAPSSVPAATTAAVPAPSYPQPHLYNISNRRSAAFYGTDRPSAYELHPAADAVLMQCRHCLRYALGGCTLHGGQPASFAEPLFLRLGDGRRFRLEFDCRQCQMNVYAAGNGRQAAPLRDTKIGNV